MQIFAGRDIWKMEHYRENFIVCTPPKNKEELYDTKVNIEENNTRIKL